MIKYMRGDLVSLAKQGEFSLITHACHCFNNIMTFVGGRMSTEFLCNEFPLESKALFGDINKLGQIDCKRFSRDNGFEPLTVINSYTQYYHAFNTPHPLKSCVDYGAVGMCFKKISNKYSGHHLGLTLEGFGARDIIERIITRELKNLLVTIVLTDNEIE